jgi:GMP synthase (glutamine-hydrolysing)
MRMAVLQHVPFEGPAAIAEWAAGRGVPLSVYHVYRGGGLPTLDSFDMLTVMGGPMSVNDTATLPWLAPEIDLVRASIEGGKTVLGVCLGSQMIAKALGAPVYPAKVKEIGWFPVSRVAGEGAATLFSALPQTFTPFHWHGETFDLPPGALRLAETPHVPNQAFQIGAHVLGLQFHMEATPESVADLAKNCADEIGTGPFEQPANQILAQRDQCDAIRPMLDTVLDALTGLRAPGT